VKRIRVLVAYRECLMRDLLLTLLRDQPDLEVINGGTRGSEIRRAVADARPDFVIVELDSTDARPRICDDLLGRHSSLRILGLAPERNTALLFWPAPAIRCAHMEGSGSLISTLRGITNLPAGKPMQRVEKTPFEDWQRRLSS